MSSAAITRAAITPRDARHNRSGRKISRASNNSAALSMGPRGPASPHGSVQAKP